MIIRLEFINQKWIMKKSVNKGYYWVLPSAIDLPAILKKHPPNFRYKIDYFYFILETICNKMEYVDLQNEQKWVRLNAKKMQLVNCHYDRYLTYLNDHRIINISKKYVVGQHSRGYRITKTYYKGDPVKIGLKNGDLIVKRKYEKYHKEHLSQKEEFDTSHGYLTKWFNDKLQIDNSAAKDEVDRLFPTHVNTSAVKGEIDYEKIHGRFKALRAIDRLASSTFYYKVDANIGRFHSNLTNIKKELRNYISYDSQTLINLDITNSQPLLSGILLNEDFYKEGEKLNLFQLPSTLNLFNNKPKLIQQTCENILNTIMISTSHGTQASTEFQEYLDICQSGKFYENLSSLLYPGRPFDRKKMKTLAFTIFFCDNRHSPKQRKLEEPFVNRFPTVYKIFSLLKKHDNAILSNILQCTESLIMVETVARKIGKQHPEIPIFTIHDSVATTEGNEKYVEQILRKEIRKITGLKATIGRDVWTPAVLDIKKAA
jgi:hypothetical protein